MKVVCQFQIQPEFLFNRRAKGNCPEYCFLNFNVILRQNISSGGMSMMNNAVFKLKLTHYQNEMTGSAIDLSAR
jgi:hypothetical protein